MVVAAIARVTVMTVFLLISAYQRSLNTSELDHKTDVIEAHDQS
jgi:hypothetical protein